MWIGIVLGLASVLYYEWIILEDYAWADQYNGGSKIRIVFVRILELVLLPFYCVLKFSYFVVVAFFLACWGFGSIMIQAVEDLFNLITKT